LCASPRSSHEIVLPWTFRNEHVSAPAHVRVGNPPDPDELRQHGEAEGELRLFLALGVDGPFSDLPDTAVAIRNKAFGAPVRPPWDRRP
jgi:glycerophosphoryl diester phosphodiesterase